MRRAATTAYKVLLYVFCAGVVLQVFFAGLGIFGAESFETHTGFGWMLHSLLTVVLVLAIAGPRTRETIVSALALLILVTAQIALVGARDDAPGVAALHPVLVLAALGLGLWMVQRTRVAGAAGRDPLLSEPAR